MAHLTFEERKLVASVAEFFQLKKDSSRLINVNNVARSTAEACRVSESTAKCCQHEAEKESQENNAIDSKEVQSGGRPKIIIDEFTASAIRRVVHSFYRIREHPTLDKVLDRCEENGVDLPKLSRTSFWRLMKSMGFSYRRTEGNRQIMMEKPEIVAKRHTFL